MESQNEIWKEVKNYEGIYEVSNLGNVKSLSRAVLRKGKYPFLSKEKILSKGISTSRYYNVVLSKNSIKETKAVHQLVAESFLNHIRNGKNLVVNHINFIRIDNRVENLEIVSMRENSNRKHIKSSSKYVGVSFYKTTNKWKSAISIKGKIKHLGYFNTEIEASQAYENYLSNLKN